MPNILLRNIDDKLDKALRIRAIEHGCTREAEIKSILTAAINTLPQQQPLSEVLMNIPKIDADVDELFKRADAISEDIDLN